MEIITANEMLVVPFVIGIALGFWWSPILKLTIMVVVVVGIVVYVDGATSLKPEQLLGDMVMIVGNAIENNLKDAVVFAVGVIIGVIVSK